MKVENKNYTITKKWFFRTGTREFIIFFFSRKFHQIQKFRRTFLYFFFFNFCEIFYTKQFSIKNKKYLTEEKNKKIERKKK